MNQKVTAVIAGVFLIGALVALLGLFGETEDPEPIDTVHTPRNGQDIPAGNQGSAANTAPVDPPPAIPEPQDPPDVEVTQPDPLPELGDYSPAQQKAMTKIQELMAKILALRAQQPVPGSDYFEQLKRINEQIEALMQEMIALGPDAVGPLLDLLKAGAFDNQSMLTVLVGIGGEEAKAGLLEMFTSQGDYRLQQEIVNALAKWNGEIFGFYEAAFGSASDARVQMAILRHMADRGEGDVGRFFAQALNSDADRNVRIEAVRSLKKTRDPLAYDLLENMATSENEELVLRQQAIYATAATDAIRARSTLENLAGQSPSREIRASAIVALSEYYGEEAIPMLESLASSASDTEIRERALRAIKVIQTRASNGIPVPGSIDREIENRGVEIE